jgi:hypothetical protein
MSKKLDAARASANELKVAQSDIEELENIINTKYGSLEEFALHIEVNLTKVSKKIRKPNRKFLKKLKRAGITIPKDYSDITKRKSMMKDLCNTIEEAEKLLSDPEFHALLKLLEEKESNMEDTSKTANE